jgi:hypothetical protein
LERFPIGGSTRGFNAKVRLGLRKFERTFSLLNDLTKTGSGVMDQTRQELEQKAARYRQLAREIWDQPTADRILALAKELAQRAQEQK